MGNLITSLLNSSNALNVFSRALDVTENNVTNASTPGYAVQNQTFEALPFDPVGGLPGGVGAGPLQSSRNLYIEQSVRQQQTALAQSQQKVTDLTPLQNYFSVSATSGLAPSIDTLFQDFSQLSVNPNDSVSRQAVIDQANVVAQSFQNTSSGISSQASSIDTETRGSVDTINRLAGIIAETNQNRLTPLGAVDPGVDAQQTAALEELSQQASITVLHQSDGTVSVYLGGQTPLVVNNTSYAIKGDFSTAQTKILNSSGADISSQISGGTLSTLLQDKNSTLPSYQADLNTLAQSVADQINTTLSQGVDQNGATPTTGLFQYDATLGAAVTLAVNPLTPDQIAAALPGGPGGNGNALNLAALGSQKNLNGYTFAQYYGNLAGRVGRDLSTAQDNGTTQQQLLVQMQSIRSQASGVSLDQEAEKLIAYQRGYEATAKMITVLDQLTETVMSLIPSA